jgi:hypothetical protein
MKRSVIFILVIVLIIFGCNGGKLPKNVLPLYSMKVVVFDFITADEWNNARSATDSVFLKSKNKLKAYQQVLAIHHITKTVFDSSLNYYEQHPDVFKTLMDSVNAYASRLKDSAAPKPMAPKRLKKSVK